MAALGAVASAAASAASNHRAVAPDCTNAARAAAHAADLAAKVDSESEMGLSQFASSAKATAEYWGVDLSADVALLLRALGLGTEGPREGEPGGDVEGGTKHNNVGALPTALVDEDRLAADLALLMEAPVRYGRIESVKV